MVVALANLVSVFATPTEVFARLKEKPSWLVAFAVISSISVGTTWLMFPIFQQIALRSIPATLDATQMQKILSATQRLQYLGLTLIPLTLVFRWAMIGGLLYFSSVLLNLESGAKFRTFYSVATHSEMILVLMAVINILLLQIRGIELIEQITDLQAIPALDDIVADSTSNLPLFVLLSSFNPFTAWYITTMTVGTSVVTNFSKLKSAFLVSTVWLLGVGTQVALAAISTNSPLRLGR